MRDGEERGETRAVTRVELTQRSDRLLDRKFLHGHHGRCLFNLPQLFVFDVSYLTNHAGCPPRGGADKAPGAGGDPNVMREMERTSGSTERGCCVCREAVKWREVRLAARQPTCLFFGVFIFFLPINFLARLDSLENHTFACHLIFIHWGAQLGCSGVVEMHASSSSMMAGPPSVISVARYHRSPISSARRGGRASAVSSSMNTVDIGGRSKSAHNTKSIMNQRHEETTLWLASRPRRHHRGGAFTTTTTTTMTRRATASGGDGGGGGGRDDDEESPSTSSNELLREELRKGLAGGGEAQKDENVVDDDDGEGGGDKTERKYRITIRGMEVLRYTIPDFFPDFNPTPLVRARERERERERESAENAHTRSNSFVTTPR